MNSGTAFRSFLGIFGILLLAACGGGDGGSAGDGGGTGGGSTKPPVITAASLPAGLTGATYPGYTFTVASGGVAPYMWSATGTLPEGMWVGTDGQLGGVPVSSGTFSLQVSVTDSSVPALTATASTPLVIDASQLVINTTAPPPVGTASYMYPGFSFSASGGSAPFAWSATGPLPTGLALDASGLLSGTPASAGSFAFTITATDSEPTPMSASISVTIVIGVPDALAITPTAAPPAGVHGTPYPTYYFTATGGYLPQVWSATAGALPPGLMLGSDGSLSGTPTAAGTFTFTATITDSAPTPTSVSVPCTIVITEPPPPTITSGALPTATINTVYQDFTFSATDGLAPLVWSATGNLAGLSLSLDGILSGTPTITGHFPITVNVKDALNQSAVPALRTLRISLARQGTFTWTGSMAVPRTGHTATLLPGGKVLVTGGVGLASAELYDPATGTFTQTGAMAVARSGHSATLFTDASLPGYGKVLIVGGADATAELYDPTAGIFAATGNMTAVRSGQVATLLKSGKVLITGGGTETAELYDLTSGTFTATGSMTVARAGHTATSLPDGTVLVAGGGTETAELYNAASGKFAATGSLSVARTGATATHLPDGTVLIAGPDNTAELYDPTSKTITPVGNLLSPRIASTASLRSDAGVLMAGGARLVKIYKPTGPQPWCRPPGVLTRCSWIVTGSALESLYTAEIFGTESQGFTATSSLDARDGHTATLLADGSTVLIVGGTHHKVTYLHVSWHKYATEPVSTVLASASLFQ